MSSAAWGQGGWEYERAGKRHMKESCREAAHAGRQLQLQQAAYAPEHEGLYPAGTVESAVPHAFC